SAENEWLFVDEVHYNDFMLNSTSSQDVARYVDGTTNFIQILEHAMELCGRDLGSASGILEIGCGYGRIVRALPEKITPDRIYVCDVIEEASDFCAREFGVRKANGDEIGTTLRECFDVVYLLSVFTHLDEEHITQLWQKITQSLRPGGILVLTLHGPSSAAQMENYGKHWEQQKPGILDTLNKTGYYYEKYNYYSENYGMSWFSRDRFMNLIGKMAPPSIQMAPVYFGEAALDGHQDVFVFRRTAPSDATPVHQ
ncbi:MAG: class I SAM-dependent methyltransferase, partial [Bryobacteraceae bacterium]